MGPLNIALLVIMAISAIFTIILILMHSGKGTGVSDMIAASMYNATAGSGVWEKNLDRLTVLFVHNGAHVPRGYHCGYVIRYGKNIDGFQNSSCISGRRCANLIRAERHASRSGGIGRRASLRC